MAVTKMTMSWGVARPRLLSMSLRHWMVAASRLKNQADRTGQGPRREPAICEESTRVYQKWMHQVNTWTASVTSKASPRSNRADLMTYLDEKCDPKWIEISVSRCWFVWPLYSIYETCLWFIPVMSVFDSAFDLCPWCMSVCLWYLWVIYAGGLSKISVCYFSLWCPPAVLVRLWCLLWSLPAILCLWCLPIGFCLFTCEKCLFWLSVTSVISVCDVCNVSRVYEVSDNLWYLIIPDVK